MPLTIIEKEKTQPTLVNRHPMFVPLRVVQFSPHYQEESLTKAKDQVSIGDIVIGFPGMWSNFSAVLNATKQKTIELNLCDRFLVVRAYDIAQIVVCNDNEPAPIV